MTPPTETDDDVDLVDLVASNIRAEAARQGIYQMDIARALGVRQTTISKRWKGGRAWPLEDLPKVAAVLGVTVVDLVTEPDKQNPRRWIAPRGAAARSKGLEPPTFWSVIRGGVADTPCDVVDLDEYRQRRPVRAS